MPRPRRFRKEDISDPSNFVHIQHVGFGQKKPSWTQQRSLDLERENYPDREEQTSMELPRNGGSSFEGMSENDVKVERRARNSRSSMIPRHHRSTTTCIFPDNGNSQAHQLHLQNKISVDSKRGSETPSVSSLSKPTFGSLLNLSFLPLGLGKSSSKSPASSKSKRGSLLNLTASHLFSGSKVNLSENLEAVHMTGYTRRRSFSNSGEENGESTTPPKPPRKNLPESSNDATSNGPSKTPAPSRLPLAKIGRSKSTMSDFTKRPKLRLQILPPPPPVPVSSVGRNEMRKVSEDLPSPPPSPLPSPPPSPPKTPQSAPPPGETGNELDAMGIVVKRIPKSPPRSRIILLPSVESSEEPPSPQYLTPAGGSSPSPFNNNNSMFPMLSPTIPPTITPFFSTPQHADTPPIWPLQPTWPTSVSIQQTHPTIPEIPSPLKEEMETIDSEYDPVVPIVESFISNTNKSGSCDTDATISANSDQIEDISEKLLEKISFEDWPTTSKAIFHSISSRAAQQQESTLSPRGKEIYGGIIRKTVEFWMEMMGDHVNLESLTKIIDSADKYETSNF